MPSETSKKTAIAQPAPARRVKPVVLPASSDPPTKKNVAVNVNVNIDIKLHLIILALVPIITALIAAGIIA